MSDGADGVRSGLPGVWDRIVGPGATKIENLGSATGAALGFLVGVSGGSNNLAKRGLAKRGLAKRGVAAVMSADLFGGVWANATPAATRWYHGRGQGIKENMLFSAFHVHPFVVAALFRDRDPGFAVGGYAYLLAAAFAVSAAPPSLRQAVALSLYCGASSRLKGVEADSGTRMVRPRILLEAAREPRGGRAAGEEIARAYKISSERATGGSDLKQRIEPGPGQESVWDYPRPPRMENVEKKVKVVFGGVTIAYTSRAKRVLETSHPPVYYVPPEDVRMEYLSESSRTSYCEWKGRGRYYDIRVDDEITGEKRSEEAAAWFYPEPTRSFEELKDHVAFYPSKMDNSWVGGEKVEAQEGDFYGGWVTSEIVGPFKGAPGTWGW